MKTKTPTDNLTLLPHEVLEKVSKSKTPITKVKTLQNNDSFALKTILQAYYRDDVVFDLPPGIPPYREDDGLPGEQVQTINKAIRNLKNCVVQSKIPKWKKEQTFIRLLETVHAKDAKVLLDVKDKTLEESYPGLTRKIVVKAYPTLQL